MDLASFLSRAQQNGTINVISAGFENSQFSQDIPDCGLIVKDILDKLNKNMPKRIEIPTVNGAITNNSLHVDAKKTTTNSFSMEFNTICNNLLAICGYEISYNLSILLSLKHIVKQYIDELESAEDYEGILENVNVIRNIFKQEAFDVKTFTSAFITTMDDESAVFFFDSEIKPIKDNFFSGIINHISKNQERKNLSGLTLNKRLYVNEIKLLLENTVITPIEPININELLCNIGNKIAYKGWFIKAWSMIYDEILVDMLTSDVSIQVHPLDILFERLKITVHKNKYISQFLVYFEQVIAETKTSINEILGTEAVNVELSKDLLKYMAEMMLSLYTQLAYALYNYLRYNMLNKSARVHYALMYYLILNCKPKLYEFDITQQSALRYLLLPKKSIDESLSLLKTKKARVKRPVIEESTNVINESSDDEVDEEKDKNELSSTAVKRKRAPRGSKKNAKETATEPIKKTRKPRAKKD